MASKFRVVLCQGDDESSVDGRMRPRRTQNIRSIRYVTKCLRPVETNVWTKNEMDRANACADGMNKFDQALDPGRHKAEIK